MNLYITKLNGTWGMTQDIQCMTAKIAQQLGFQEMGVYYNIGGESIQSRSVRFDGMIAGMQPGDIVVCQFHTWNGLGFERGLVDHIKAYQGRVIIFIHSLEALMIRGSRFMLKDTVELYNQAEALIVPSHEMKKFLMDEGIRTGMKFIVQEMWDYTTGVDFRERPAFRKEIQCTGNLDNGSIEEWNYEIPLKLYMPAESKGQTVNCVSGLNQEELLIALSKGGFGLEWYADEQAYDWICYGNSYSLSQYLAAGIPIIVPRGISGQKLIEENHLGLVVDSLEEAAKVVESVSEEEYQEYVNHVRQFAPALRNGYYTKKCLIEAVQSLFREDMGKAFIQTDDIYDPGNFVFLTTTLKKSYGGNLALSWNLKGKADGFLVYDAEGNLIEETENEYQHYMLIKGHGEDEQFVVKAYVNTKRGKMIVARSHSVSLCEESYEKPLISLIMPVYNAENYIVRTVDTVLAQTFSDLEIILVDDGSTDRTSDVLGWYEKTYPNIVVTRQANSGVPAARNMGINLANGEYIAFMDNDDMLRPDMMEELYTSIKKNECDIAITSIYQIVNNEYAVEMQCYFEEDVAITNDDFLHEYAINGYALFSIWNKLYRASIVKEHPFPLIMFDDEAWTPYILSYADKICYVDKKLYEYDRSVRQGTLVDKWFQKTAEEIFVSHKNAIMFYLENGNPKRLSLLKVFAKSELGLFSITTGYEEYAKLAEKIDKMKEKS